MPEILEIIMILCFGASWPFNVAKSYRARTAKGKSLLFLILIEVGYLFRFVCEAHVGLQHGVVRIVHITEVLWGDGSAILVAYTYQQQRRMDDWCGDILTIAHGHQLFYCAARGVENGVFSRFGIHRQQIIFVAALDTEMLFYQIE